MISRVNLTKRGMLFLGCLEFTREKYSVFFTIL